MADQLRLFCAPEGTLPIIQHNVFDTADAHPRPQLKLGRVVAKRPPKVPTAPRKQFNARAPYGPSDPKKEVQTVAHRVLQRCNGGAFHPKRLGHLCLEPPSSAIAGTQHRGMMKEDILHVKVSNSLSRLKQNRRPKDLRGYLAEASKCIEYLEKVSEAAAVPGWVSTIEEALREELDFSLSFNQGDIIVNAEMEVCEVGRKKGFSSKKIGMHSSGVEIVIEKFSACIESLGPLKQQKNLGKYVHGVLTCIDLYLKLSGFICLEIPGITRAKLMEFFAEIQAEVDTTADYLLKGVKKLHIRAMEKPTKKEQIASERKLLLFLEQSVNRLSKFFSMSKRPVAAEIQKFIKTLQASQEAHLSSKYIKWVERRPVYNFFYSL